MKIGLALGGGAARGSAHVGIIRALENLSLTPNIISGCSIGALIGAAFATGNLDRLEHWMRTLNKREMLRYFELNFTAGLIDTSTFNQFLVDVVCGESQQIESLDIRFAAVATELRSGQEVWLQNGSMLDAVRASIALPGLFQPVPYQGGWLVDGGLVNPVPVSVCRAMGADVVIAVNLNADIVGKHFSGKKPEGESDRRSGWRQRVNDYSNGWLGTLFDKTEVPGLFDTLASSFNIMQDRVTRSRMAGDPPDIVLSPRVSEIGLLEFYRAEEAIREGSACVERMTQEIGYVISRKRR